MTSTFLSCTFWHCPLVLRFKLGINPFQSRSSAPTKTPLLCLRMACSHQGFVIVLVLQITNKKVSFSLQSASLAPHFRRLCPYSRTSSSIDLLPQNGLQNHWNAWSLGNFRPHKLHFYTPRSCFLLIAITLGIESPVWWDLSGGKNTVQTGELRFLHCYYNGYDEETGKYMRPFLEETFEGAGKEFIGALYYVSDCVITMQSPLCVCCHCTLAPVRHYGNSVDCHPTASSLQSQIPFYEVYKSTLISSDLYFTAHSFSQIWMVWWNIESTVCSECRRPFPNKRLPHHHGIQRNHGRLHLDHCLLLLRDNSTLPVRNVW